MKQIKFINRQSGFSMVEVLVALVVLSIGLLGMAGLYVTTLRSGTGAIFRMQAVYLASDMADRIRANRNAGGAYAGAAAASDCVTNTCAPATMAANDLSLWQTEIGQALTTAATGTVAYLAGASATQPATYTITLTWNDPGSTSNQTYVLVAQI